MGQIVKRTKTIIIEELHYFVMRPLISKKSPEPVCFNFVNMLLSVCFSRQFLYFVEDVYPRKFSLVVEH